jgi:hypothetical protein
MKFRNYCVVIMGETFGALDEIIKISEIKPNFFLMTNTGMTQMI